MESDKKQIIDLKAIILRLWQKKKKFFVVIPIVMVVSAIYIFPQPRYYRAEVSLAPETGGTELGGLSSIASSFGFSLGGLSTSDAIHPMLYPELFESPQFIVNLFDIKIRTVDGLECDYYTYLKSHQKKNPYTGPISSFTKWMRSLVSSPKPKAQNNGGGINAFSLTEEQFEIMETLQDKITCTNDKQTEVTTIKVEAQDPLVCALLADSVRMRLQDFLIQYRTSKARMDLTYYRTLSDSAWHEYEIAAAKYSNFCDANKNITRQVERTRQEQLLNDMHLKQTTYQAYQAQVQAMKAQVQEKTPAFTTLRSTTVPVKPAGPKRVLFILGSCMFAGLITSFWLARDLIFKKE